MARTAKPLPQYLSQYLTDRAKPFLIYPGRNYQLAAMGRQLIDTLTRQFVDWRKTFQPPGKAQLVPLLEDARVLDQLYSRDLLAAVPDIVARTRDLKDLTLAGIADAEALTYLREAATCYIFGLFQGTAALSRSAVERSLRARAASVFPRAAVDAAELQELIDKFGVRFLPKEAVSLAHRVRIGGNEVLHHQAADRAKALALVEHARSVVLALSARK